MIEKISFVIPCYRSQRTIYSVVEEITLAMNGLGECDYEIILVNDHSPDETFSVIHSIVKQDNHIIGVDLARNFGQHAALMAGFHQVTGDVIVCLDDDGQTPAKEVGKLLSKIEAGYDVVYASYEHKQHSAFRNIGSWLNSKMTEFMLDKPQKLMITSYFAARRFVIDEMLRYEHCYPYVIGLVLRTTKSICNVPVCHRQRKEGNSGYTMGKLVSLWLNGFTSFSVKPLRMATYFGLFSSLCGLMYLIYIIVLYLSVHSAPLGWSSTTAILLIMGGVILIVLGLIGEYVGRIYMCTNAAPQFVIREIVKQEQDIEKHEHAKNTQR